MSNFAVQTTANYVLWLLLNKVTVYCFMKLQGCSREDATNYIVVRSWILLGFIVGLCMFKKSVYFMQICEVQEEK